MFNSARPASITRSGPTAPPRYRVTTVLILTLALVLGWGHIGTSEAARITSPNLAHTNSPAPSPYPLHGWGRNDYGQLGNGSTTSSSTPVVVSLPAGASPVQAAGGYSHSLAIGSDGNLYAWGDNNYGQLGNGSTAISSTTPVTVSLPAGVAPISVSAGGNHSLAIGSDGNLYAWGRNDYGQLGNGTRTSSSTPVVVSLPAGVSLVQVAGGGNHSLAIGNDGKLYAWGFNYYGQLGNGTTSGNNPNPNPIMVNLPAGVTPSHLAAGYGHSLAIGSDGKLYAWGGNSSGQLGNGTTTNSSSPIVVNLPAGVTPTRIATGVGHSLAIGSDGKLYAWGGNSSGQLGNGTTTNSSSPIVVGSVAGIANPFVAGGGFHTLALLSIPTQLTPTGGSPQSATVGTAFAAPLVATVRDLANNPVSSATVTFTAPVSEASGTFTGGSAVYTGTTDASGVVTATSFMANMIAGSYSVTATVSGVITPATFALTNTANSASAYPLYAWGDNPFGELGNGTHTNSNVPVLVKLPPGVKPTYLAAGYKHNLVTGSDSKLYAWGWNYYGQLGNGTTSANNPNPNPAVVSLPAGVTPTQVAAGYAHSLVIGSDGNLYAWGSNAAGELGNGTYNESSMPVVVRLPAGIAPIRVVAGVSNSLIIGSDANLYAWGFNQLGQLGNGTYTNTNMPIVVKLPAGVTPTQVDSGSYHSLAIGSDGKLYAWGDNEYGQLGDGTNTTSSIPVVVKLPAGVTPAQVDSGYGHSLAIGSDGKLYAWGYNQHGELGDGTYNDSSIPVVVRLPAGVTPLRVIAGYAHSLAIGSDANLYAWGYNIQGQLGDGTNTTSSTPVVVGSVAGVANPLLAAGAFHSLGMLARPGQIAATGGSNQSTPVGTAFATPLVASVRDSANNPVSNVTVTFTAPSSGASGIFAGGSTVYTGTTDASGTVTATTFTANILVGSYNVTATVSGVITPAIFSLSNTSGPARAYPLYAWGTNQYGQLGNGTYNTSFTPVALNLPAGVTFTAIAAGGNHNLAIGNNGNLYTWGHNNYGQLGNGTLTDSATPLTVSLPAGVRPVSVTAGYDHSLAIGNDNNLYAWGYNDYGQLGSSTITYSNIPLVVNLPAGVTPTAIAAGYDHSLAIGSDNNLYAWGHNDYGQLGNGTLTDSATPVVVNLPAGVTPTSIATGFFHSLAIGSDGKLYAWGRNAGGQLGNGNNNISTIPVTVNLPAGVMPTVIRGGGEHSLAIGNDGKLYAWGFNHFGQLGNGTVSDSNSPLVVNLAAGVIATAIAAGSEHSLAIGSDNKFYVWGYGADGQLGAGSIIQSNSPLVIGPVDGSLLAAGGYHSLAVLVLPGQIIATAGSPQNALIGTSFTAPLVATVRDVSNNPISSVVVTFTAPSSGASGAFTGGSSVYTGTTDASGTVTATTFTANTIANSYSVTATVSGVVTPLTFALTNTPGPASALVPVSGDNQQATVSTSFGSPLVAKVTDSLGNAVGGAEVDFAAPGSGASATFGGGSLVYTGTTNAAGLITTGIPAANSSVGSYTVTATLVLPGVSTRSGVRARVVGPRATSVQYHLTNLAQCNPLYVTSSGDDGSCGTLRAALVAATSSPTKTVTISLAANSTITVTTGLTLTSGVAITTTAQCGIGAGNTMLPPVVIQGVGTNSGPGLTLSGHNSLYGLWVRGFSGVQIKAPVGSSTKMQCVRASKL